MIKKRDIGRYNVLLSIYAETDAGDGQGGGAVTESKTGESWAHIEPMTGQRAVELGELLHTQPYLIFMIYRDDITIDESSILKSGSRTFVVHSIGNIEERDQVLTIIAKVKK